MNLVVLAVLALVLLAVALYAQWRIGAHTRGNARIVATRLFLALVAAAFGWTLSAGATVEAERLLVFLAGFGMVHVPAAVILFIKRRRGSGRT